MIPENVVPTSALDALKKCEKKADEAAAAAEGGCGKLGEPQLQTVDIQWIAHPKQVCYGLRSVCVFLHGSILSCCRCCLRR